MHFLFIFLLTIISFQNVEGSLVWEKRIVNGKDADVLAYPWMISIGYYQTTGHWFHVCGGIWWDKTWILTAAHCVYDAGHSKYQDYVLTGHARINEHNFASKLESKVSIAQFKKVIVHPNFIKEGLNYKKLDRRLSQIYDITKLMNYKLKNGSKYKRIFFSNDIALIELTRPLVQQIDFIYHLTRNVSFPSDGSKCILAGWGNTHMSAANYRTYIPDILQEAEITINQDTKSCDYDQISYLSLSMGVTADTLLKYVQVMDNKKQICAGGNFDSNNWVSACKGDSGGPLLCFQDNKWKLAGITSYVISKGRNICAGHDVYTRVSAYIDWIESVVGG